MKSVTGERETGRRDEPIIGVVGGMGPYAGIDLCKKIFDQTRAAGDQDHLGVAMLSLPSGLPDRTEFLLGRSKESPAEGIFDVLRRLERLGARVAGIPCNTSHASAILQPVLDRMRCAGSTLRLLHMVREVARHLAELDSKIGRVGILGTTGTVRARVYDEHLSAGGFEVVYPDETVQRTRVHAAIYDPQYGIKAGTAEISDVARSHLRESVEHLLRKRCDAVVLACTELPLAIDPSRPVACPTVDATLVLARALIRAVAPEKLRAGDPS